MWYWHIILIDIIAVLSRLPVWSSKVTDELMTKKVVIDPFSNLFSSLLQSQNTTVKFSRFFQVIDWNRQVERCQFVLRHYYYPSINKDSKNEIRNQVQQVKSRYGTAIPKVKSHIRENKNILKRRTDSYCIAIIKTAIKMKQIEFQHFKKAPHPFEQYGNLPPAAYRNRSIPQDYISLPQGQQAFVNKVGKRQFQNKHQSSIKQHWLGSDQNDSLSNQVVRQNYRVLGKSLQTRDIEGAQGGSLKSPAVKYKQKAQQMKMYGKLNGFDKYDFEQQQYKLQIQNALKYQHSNDVQIGKLISKKGHGHMLNPEKNQPIDKNISPNNSRKSSEHESHQIFLKEKYDNFDSKNQQYKQFFQGLKSKQDNYGQFFGKLKQNGLIEKSKEQIEVKRQKINTFDQYDSKEMPTPKITSREHEYGLTEKFKTIEMRNDKNKSHVDDKTYLHSPNQHQFIKQYQPPNYPKKSLQSQFKEEQRPEPILNLSRINDQRYDQYNSLSSSRDSQKSPLQEKDLKMVFAEKQLVRKLNPTNLSHIIGSGSFSFQHDQGF